jgi:hypothetical protein
MINREVPVQLSIPDEVSLAYYVKKFPDDINNYVGIQKCYL